MALPTAGRGRIGYVFIAFLLCAALFGGMQSAAAQSNGSAPGAQCTTVCFVDAVTGDDANSGATPATALRTIQAAVERVQPSGEVRVAPGVYAERVVITRTLRLVGSDAAETWLRASDDLPPAESPDSAIVVIAGASV